MNVLPLYNHYDVTFIKATILTKYAAQLADPTGKHQLAGTQLIKRQAKHADGFCSDIRWPISLRRLDRRQTITQRHIAKGVSYLADPYVLASLPHATDPEQVVSGVMDTRGELRSYAFAPWKLCQLCQSH